MKKICTILSSAYLLLMVLLPWLHMPLHGQQEIPAEHIHHSCSHHNHDQGAEHNHNPESDDCGFCGLLLITAEVIDVDIFYWIDFRLSEIQQSNYEFTPVVRHSLQRARAPPLMSV